MKQLNKFACVDLKTEIAFEFKHINFKTLGFICSSELYLDHFNCIKVYVLTLLANDFLLLTFFAA